MEVRDVHYSHYGRMCPIETPEGPNIGLINSLSSYAKVNEFGFIETPYRKVIPVIDEATGETKMQVTGEIRYLTADEEDRYVVAQAGLDLDANDCLPEKVIVRHRGENLIVPAERVDFVDVSPKQIVSVATACIPFFNGSQHATSGHSFINS